MFYASGHSEDFIKSWAIRLRFFRYVIAPGGHAGDLDELVLALRCAGEDELIALFNDLHIPCKRHQAKPPQAEPGKGYSAAEYDRFPHLIPGTYWIEQPLWQTIDSARVFVWCTTQMAKFSISGSQENPWVISQREFEDAYRLEDTFKKYAQRIIDPPLDVKTCICPKYFPHYWQID
jgi:hypothetical protein